MTSADRVEALERAVMALRLRFLTLMLALVIGCVLQALIMLATLRALVAPTPVVEAEQFVLVDSSGAVAAVLRVAPEPIKPPEGMPRGAFNRPYRFHVERGDGRLWLTIGHEGVREHR